jgi:transcriptional regulator with XRE-family HTH domain
MSRLREQFGSRLVSIRLRRGLTQEQFAELVGISVDFLSLIERGINAPSFETLERTADRLGMSVAQLFTFDEDRPKRRALNAKKTA